MKNLMFVFCLIIVITSCEINNNDAEAEYNRLMREQVEKEYEALPEALKLNKGEISLTTNYTQDGQKIIYDGKVVTNDVEPLYGLGDILIVNYDGKNEIVTIYKGSIYHAVMKYDYEVLGVKIKDNIVYTKGYRVDHVIFIKDVLEIGKPSHTYVYGY